MMNATDPYPPVTERSKTLPPLAFALLPVLGGMIEWFVQFGTSMSLETGHVPRSLLVNFECLAVIGTLYLLVVAWVVCLALYLRPKRGFRDIYCRIPLRLYGVHMLCYAVLWVTMAGYWK